MKRYDLVVIGAGPAGLSAAAEAAKCGLSVAVLDENARPGGQLFKQIHKFFGSKEHKAKIRGFRIGEELLRQAAEAGVTVVLNAVVIGLFAEKELTVRIEDAVEHLKADAVIVATGASENAAPFPGWTLPGVIGAGAAQTMMNLHGILPGRRALMLGSGNVGLVVGFQLLQAGCALAAVCDVAPRIGGYGVHAAKLARCGVPFYTGHMIVRAEGTDRVTGVIVARAGAGHKPVPGTERHFEVDTVCVAVGLSPMSQLTSMAGCRMTNGRTGYVPEVDAFGQTSVPGIFAAGDVSGIEEASSAMLKGRIAGIAAAQYLGFLTQEDLTEQGRQIQDALAGLRQGMFAPQNRGHMPTQTEEGCAISQSLLQHGFVADEEIARYPGVTRAVGIHPVIECTQNIPCNPCQDACPKGCIRVGKRITSLPAVDPTQSCIGCGMCVASCSGQAIFLVDETYAEGYASVTMPYEFLPLPREGDRGVALGRDGQPVCAAEVLRVRSAPAYDKTQLLTIKVPADMAMKARFYRAEE